MIETLPEPKALPHSHEAERAVLAAVLLDPGCLPIISGRLKVEDIYSERHRLLYQALLDIQEDGVEIDLRTLQAKLEQQAQLDAVGGVAYIAELDLPGVFSTNTQPFEMNTPLSISIRKDGLPLNESATVLILPLVYFILRVLSFE